MTKGSTPTIDDAVAVVRTLPESEQAVIAQDIIAMTKDGVLPPARSPEDQAIIAERMSRPRTLVSREDVLALLRKYNPAL